MKEIEYWRSISNLEQMPIKQLDRLCKLHDVAIKVWHHKGKVTFMKQMEV